MEQKKMVLKKKLIGFGVIFTLALLYPSTLPARLEDFHSRIIRVAFTNGYIRAMKNDLETIAILKDNPEDFQETARAAVESYIKEVFELNQQAQADNKPGKSGNAFKANSW